MTTDFFHLPVVVTHTDHDGNNEAQGNTPQAWAGHEEMTRDAALGQVFSALLLVPLSIIDPEKESRLPRQVDLACFRRVNRYTLHPMFFPRLLQENDVLAER